MVQKLDFKQFVIIVSYVTHTVFCTLSLGSIQIWEHIFQYGGGTGLDSRQESDDAVLERLGNSDGTVL